MLWILEKAGIDLEVAQALPHTPDEAGMRMAERYLRELIDLMEREDQDRWRGNAEPGREGWPDTPF